MKDLKMPDLIEQPKLDSILDSVTVYKDATVEKENAHIAKALCKFQSVCGPIDKGKQGYGYKYTDLASVVKFITPHLTLSGLSYTQLLGGDGASVSVTTILLHESGESLSSTVSSNVHENKGKGMSPIQAMGSVITYLKRYALTSILGVVSEEDTDGSASQNKYDKPSYKHKPSAKAVIKAPTMTSKEFNDIPARQDNPEKIALDILKGATSLDDLKARFKGLGLQVKNPAVISFKDVMKMKFEDL